MKTDEGAMMEQIAIERQRRRGVVGLRESPPAAWDISLLIESLWTEVRQLRDRVKELENWRKA